MEGWLDRPLPEPMLTYHQRGSVSIAWEQFQKKSSPWVMNLICKCSQIPLMESLPHLPGANELRQVSVGSGIIHAPGHSLSQVTDTYIHVHHQASLCQDIMGTAHSCWPSVSHWPMAHNLLSMTQILVSLSIMSMAVIHTITIHVPFKYWKSSKILWRHHDMLTWTCYLCYWPFVRRNNTKDSPYKGQAMCSLAVFFVVGMNNLLNKQWSCQWFEVPSCSCKITVMSSDTLNIILWFLNKLRSKNHC